MNRMVTRPIYIKIVDSSGSVRYEERMTHGEDGPAKLFASVHDQYMDEWRKQDQQNPGTKKPILSMVGKQEYDDQRFNRRA